MRPVLERLPVTYVDLSLFDVAADDAINARNEDGRLDRVCLFEPVRCVYGCTNGRPLYPWMVCHVLELALCKTRLQRHDSDAFFEPHLLE